MLIISFRESRITVSYLVSVFPPRTAIMPRRPPIFSGPTIGNTPQQYLHRARMFRSAAINLPDYSNGEQYWPKYALLTHAIELALKAFAQPNNISPGKEPASQHEFERMVSTCCCNADFSDDQSVRENGSIILNELHLTRYAAVSTESASLPVPTTRRNERAVTLRSTSLTSVFAEID